MTWTLYVALIAVINALPVEIPAQIPHAQFQSEEECARVGLAYVGGPKSLASKVSCVGMPIYPTLPVTPPWLFQPKVVEIK